MKVSKHFYSEEFRCKGNAKGICKCNSNFVSAELLIVLEDVREHFGKPITVYSGYRCPKYNKHVGGASRSKHKLGIASDIHIEGIKPRAIFNYLAHKYHNKYGLGNYPNFTHIDIRPTKARWGY